MGGDEVLKRERLNWTEAMLRGKELPYAFIRTWSSVTLGRTPDVIPESVIEARFFNERQEIRVFERNGTLEGVSLQSEPGDVCYRKTYEVANPVFGNSLTVQYELEADGDGQYAVAVTRLADWKG